MMISVTAAATHQ